KAKTTVPRSILLAAGLLTFSLWLSACGASPPSLSALAPEPQTQTASQQASAQAAPALAVEMQPTEGGFALRTHTLLADFTPYGLYLSLATGDPIWHWWLGDVLPTNAVTTQS